MQTMTFFNIKIHKVISTIYFNLFEISLAFLLEHFSEHIISECIGGEKLLTILFLINIDGKKVEKGGLFREKILGALAKNKPAAIDEALKEFERTLGEDKLSDEESGIMALAKSQKDRLEAKDRMTFKSCA